MGFLRAAPRVAGAVRRAFQLEVRQCSGAKGLLGESMLTSPGGVEKLPHPLGGHADGDRHELVVLLVVDHDGCEERDQDREGLPVGAGGDLDLLAGGVLHARHVHGAAAWSGLQLVGLVAHERVSEEAERDALRRLRAPFEEHGDGGVHDAVAGRECADARVGGLWVARGA